MTAQHSINDPDEAWPIRACQFKFRAKAERAASCTKPEPLDRVPSSLFRGSIGMGSRVCCSRPSGNARHVGDGGFRTRFWGRGSISTAPPATSHVSDEEQGTSVAISNEPTVLVSAVEPDRPLVLAADLPPAADALEALFTEEQPAAEDETPSAETIAAEIPTEESDVAIETSSDAPLIDEPTTSESQNDAAVEHAAISQAIDSFAESQPSSSSADGSTAEAQPSEAAAETHVEMQSATGVGEDSSREENVAEVTVEVDSEAEAQESAEVAEPIATLLESSTEASSEPPPGISFEENLAEESPVSDASDGSERPEITPSSDWAFEEKLASHREWLESQGATGKKANWANVSLEDHELIGINLRFADLHAANLAGADLLMADLRDTCLVRANLQEACLVGANLEGANLEGASLATSMGLVARQLAGTNLHDATLPPEVLEFGALAEFERASRSAYQYYVAMMTVSVLSALVIWRTKDAQLITDSGLVNIPHFPAAAAALPAEEIYLIAPVLLFILYFTFHFHLKRLWNAALELPAVFPDGRPLGQTASRVIAGLLGAHFRWMNREAGAGALVAEKIFRCFWPTGSHPQYCCSTGRAT